MLGGPCRPTAMPLQPQRNVALADFGLALPRRDFSAFVNAGIPHIGAVVLPSPSCAACAAEYPNGTPEIARLEREREAAPIRSCASGQILQLPVGHVRSASRPRGHSAGAPCGHRTDAEALALQAASPALWRVRTAPSASFPTFARVDTKLALRQTCRTTCRCPRPIMARCLSFLVPVPEGSARSRVSGADVYLIPHTTEISLVPYGTMDSMLGAPTFVSAGGPSRTVVDARRRVLSQKLSRSAVLSSRTLDGALRLFEYEIDADSFLRITRAHDPADRLRAEVLPIPKTLENATTSGHINETAPPLFQSIEAAGEGADLAIAMAEVFAGEIDFNSDLQPGDRYAVTFERFTREGRPPSYGVITAARFENDGRVLHAIRFTAPATSLATTTAGPIASEFFLRSPLKFVPQVTSGFSAIRMHPVLHTARAHRGVDTAPRRRAGRRGGRRPRRLRHVRQRQRTNGATAARVGVRVVLPSPVGVRTGNEGRLIDRPRRHGRASRIHGTGHWSASSLWSAEERRLREPAARAPEPAAG